MSLPRYNSFRQSGPDLVGRASPGGALNQLGAVKMGSLEGVLPHADPTDSVCLRTASMEWNVLGKHGPHGELFFFLIHKELATVPVSETFSPFFIADIRTCVF